MANTQIRAGNEKQTERKHPCGNYYISRKGRKAPPSQAITFLKFFALSATSACGKNTCVVIIYLTQRAQRARSYNFLAVHADAEVVASFTATGERREDRNIWHCLCYKRIFYIFVVTINDNIV